MFRSQTEKHKYETLFSNAKNYSRIHLIINLKKKKKTILFTILLNS